MRLDGVEHWDHFQDETIYWLDLSDMPEPIQQAARRIDGKAYNDRCFGTPKNTQSQQLKAHRSAQKQPVLFHRKIGGKNR